MNFKFLFFLIPVIALASTTEALDSNKRIEIMISNHETNRLTVSGDRISSVFGETKNMAVEIEETHGHCFIKPIEANFKHANISIITEKGKVQDVRLVLKPIEAQTAIFKEKTEEIPYPQLLAEITKALFYNQVPAGFEEGEKEVFNKKASGLKITTIKSVYGKENRVSSFSAHIFQIENISENKITLIESGLRSSQDCAFLINKKILNPKEKSRIIVIRRTSW